MVTYISLWSEKQLGPVLRKKISECSLNSLDTCQPNDMTNSCLIETLLTLFFFRLVVCLLISCCRGAVLTAGPKDPSRLWFSNSSGLSKLSHSGLFLSGNLAHSVQSFTEASFHRVLQSSQHQNWQSFSWVFPGTQYVVSCLVVSEQPCLRKQQTGGGKQPHPKADIDPAKVTVREPWAHSSQCPLCCLYPRPAAELLMHLMKLHN